MIKITSFVAISLLAFCFTNAGFADPTDSTRYYLADTSRATFHFQLTTIYQYHPPFQATYTGQNSLKPYAESATSLTSTLFAGVKLWNGASIYIDPEIAGGSGLSGVTGIAGFTNGETPRIGNPAPSITLARAYYQQIIGLSNKGTEHIPDGQNQIAQDAPIDRLTMTLGKFALSDFFDNNAFSHDPRTQFENWALMENGAWDYPANTHGYTEAFVIDAKFGDWSARASTAAEPTYANGPTVEYRAGAHGETVEIEHRQTFGEQSGTVRLLLYNNTAQMGNYDEALSSPQFDTDVTKTRQYGRNKYGFGLNIDQEITDAIGAFIRAGWSDGRNETWAFTEIDRTVSLGALLQGKLWERDGDYAGIAGLMNGLSDDHRRYLATGGYGFIIGDGALNYAPETIAEIFYALKIRDEFIFTGDYQFVANPAYNADRGPVSVWSLRAHVGF
jgi:high affinity Mn2+ porin